MKNLRLVITSAILMSLLSMINSKGYCGLENLFKLDLVQNSCDYLITYDLVSNREWLYLTETVDFSYNDLTGPDHDCNPICSRGEFQGWTLASVEDVTNFISDAGIYYGDTSSYSYSLFREFILLVGLTFASPWFNLAEARGFTRDLASTDKVKGIQLSSGGSRLGSQISPTFLFIDVDRNSRGIEGAWLYRPSSLQSPYANFCASLTTTGIAPFTAKFVNRSYHATSWLWDFGDGGTSTERDPAHTYANPGRYTVSLTVNGAEGSDTETVTDYIIVQTPSFYDAASTEINANYNSDVFVYNWNTTFSDYDGLKYSLEQANDATAKAYAQANIATNQNTSFWGTYALVYMVAEMNTRTAALPYIDLAKYYASYQSYVMAEYYSAYAFSINALADLYNGSAIWCCSIEGNRVGAPTTNLPASPSFYSAAYNGWLANINFASSLAYLYFVVDNPAYFPMVQLYASTAYEFAQAAYNDATAALAAAGPDYTVWALNAVQYAANDLKYRAESLFYINSAVLSYQEGDLESALQQLVKGYGSGQYADAENARLIWCASMESKGGTK